jgi:phospholipase C
LASVIWLSAGSIQNEHPPAPVAPGETWTANQVNAVMKNPYLWNNTVMFITWDDFGGFYDHVAPIVDNQGWRNGFRVPVICVGKYCKPGFSNTSFVFESMLKCVENAYRLGPLPGGLFDATANDLCTGCVAGTGCNGHSNNGMIDLTLDNPPSL